VPPSRDGLGPFYQGVIAVNPLEPWNAASAAYRLEKLARTLPFSVSGARLVPSNNNDVWRLETGGGSGLRVIVGPSGPQVDYRLPSSRSREEIPERLSDLGAYRRPGDDHADHGHRRVSVSAGPGEADRYPGGL